MDEINLNYLKDYPLQTIENTEKIIEQMKKNICKIKINNECGTGFFCKIPFNSKKISALITCNHIINENILKDNKFIKVTLNDEKEEKNIEINKKKFYTNINNDITIIEINTEKDNINYFLELDENIFNNNYASNNYDKNVYIIQYPKINGEQKASVSFGLINQINDNEITHCCHIELGSSGSPILSLSNNKVIGINKGIKSNCNYNIGIYLKKIINDYLQIKKNSENIENNKGININNDNNKEDEKNNEIHKSNIIINGPESGEEMVKKNNESENKIEKESNEIKKEENNSLPSFFFGKTKIGPETNDEEICENNNSNDNKNNNYNKDKGKNMNNYSNKFNNNISQNLLEEKTRIGPETDDVEFTDNIN